MQRVLHYPVRRNQFEALSVNNWPVPVWSISVQSDGAARSPAVFAAMISYIRDVLDVFGIDLLHSKVWTQEIFGIFF